MIHFRLWEVGFLVLAASMSINACQMMSWIGTDKATERAQCLTWPEYLNGLDCPTQEFREKMQAKHIEQLGVTSKNDDDKKAGSL